MIVHEPEDIGFDCYSGCQISKQFLQWDQKRESYEDFILQVKYFREVKSEDREYCKGGIRLTIREKVCEPKVHMPQKPRDNYMEKYLVDEQDENYVRKKKGKK